MRPCETCGTALVRSQTRFCSVACIRRDRAKYVTAKPRAERPTSCVACGRPIPEDRRNYAAVAYCSVTCNAKTKTARIMARRRRATTRTIKCAQCERPHTTHLPQARFCSVRCRERNTAARRRAAAREAWATNRPEPAHTECLNCGAGLGPKKRKYCSAACGWRWHEERRGKRRHEAVIRHDVRPLPPDTEPALPALACCTTCRYATPSVHAESGYLCNRSAIICRPLGPATLYERLTSTTP